MTIRSSKLRKSSFILQSTLGASVRGTQNRQLVMVLACQYQINLLYVISLRAGQLFKVDTQ